jgi:hypothetical protein
LGGVPSDEEDIFVEAVRKLADSYEISNADTETHNVD